MKRVIPWTDADLAKRELVLQALVQKELKQIVRKVNAELRAGILTAAAAEPPPEEGMSNLEQIVFGAWSVFVQTELVPFVDDTFTESAELVAEGVEQALGLIIPPVSNDFADDYLQNTVNRMVGVGQNVWLGIRKELVEGFAAGEGIPQLAARLTAYAGLSEGRAETVARTEVIGAANAGSYFQMLESGLECQKEWLATMDPRTRVSHQHADEQQVDLTDEFSVGIYKDGVKIGDEGMEFPGDPSATAGNVINCRCSLGYIFDDDEDDVLTSDGFVEAEHPRDKAGKFAKKVGTAFLPDLASLSDNQFMAFVKGLSQSQWDKFSSDQQDSILKRSGPIADPTNAMTDKLFKLFKGGKAEKTPAPPTTPAPVKEKRPLSGIDTTSGKPVKLGKPIKLRVKALFGTTYEEGAIVAVKKDSNERIIWEDKKMHRQTFDGSKWNTTESLTRGALMAKYKNEEGWTTPTTDDESSPAVPAATPTETGGKPIKLKVNVLYNKKYADGDVVAEKPGTFARIVWNGKTNKLDRQTLLPSNNQWVTTESLTRGAAYKKYKDEEGWQTPGGPTPTPQAPEIVAPAPSESVLPAEAPAVEAPSVTLDPATGKFTKPVTITAVWNGKTYTQKTQVPYKFASVVKYGWDDQKEFVYSWHKTESAAAKGELTPMQKKNGAKVIAVIPAEWPEGLETSTPTPAAAPGKYNAETLKAATLDPNIPLQTVILEEAGPDGTVFQIRKSSNGKIRLVHNTSKGYLIDDQFLVHDSIKEENIAAVFEGFAANHSADIPPVAVPDAPKTMEVLKDILDKIAANQAVPAKAPAPFKMSADALIGKTSTTYTPGQVVAEHPATNRRLIWHPYKKKYTLQIKGSSGTWHNEKDFTKQAAYQQYKNTSGWITPTQKHDASGGDSPALAPIPAVAGDPVPTYETVGKPVKAPKFTVDELKKQADKHNLSPAQSKAVFDEFRNPPGMGTTYTTSPGDQVFKAALLAQRKHNAANPNNQLTLLQTLRVVDEQGTAAAPAGTVNKHLYETAVTQWLQSPAGLKNAQDIIDDASMSKAEKAAKAKEKATAAYKKFLTIEVSKPNPQPGDSYKPITDSESSALQNQNIPINDLPQEQKASIQDYKYGSGTINGFLRSFGESNTSGAKDAENIQKAMRPMPKPVLLYRNVSSIFSTDFTPTVEQLNALKGKKMTEHGFASTSIDPEVFGGNAYRFNIQVPAGTPAMYVQHLGVKSHQSEKEWILASGLHYEIIKAEKVGYKIVIDVKVVP